MRIVCFVRILQCGLMGLAWNGEQVKLATWFVMVTGMTLRAIPLPMPGLAGWNTLYCDCEARIVTAPHRRREAATATRISPALPAGCGTRAADRASSFHLSLVSSAAAPPPPPPPPPKCFPSAQMFDTEYKKAQNLASTCLKREIRKSARTTYLRCRNYDLESPFFRSLLTSVSSCFCTRPKFLRPKKLGERMNVKKEDKQKSARSLSLL